ncbi:hypothetical protein [Waltera sp.]|uniref:hypothetical protein n=1 Tax=Waltera sp. TaxID=2815806 RepID=UPI00307C3743
MKAIRVVAAVICDSIEHKTKIFSIARGYEEFNSRAVGNFPVGRLKPERPSSRQLSE